MNRNNVNKFFNIVPKNVNHLIVETLKIPNAFGFYVAVPKVQNRYNVNNDFNIVAQDDNQHLYLNVFPCRQKRPMEYILTFNSSVRITQKVPQTLASESITLFIANLYCVFGRKLSRDDISIRF